MAAMTEETGNQLLALLQAQQAKQQQHPPAMVQQPMPAQALGVNGFGLPGMPRMPAMMPAAAMQPAAGFGPTQLQAHGISVTINYNLPDGSQLPINVHFGGEHLQNLPAFVQAIYGMFGSALKTWTPRQNFGGPAGPNGGWQGGGYAYHGGRGRRW